MFSIFKRKNQNTGIDPQEALHTMRRIYAASKEAITPNISVLEIAEKFKQSDGIDLKEIFPNPTPALRKYAKEEEAFKEIMLNSQVITSYTSRKNATKSKEWKLEIGDASEQHRDEVEAWLKDIGVYNLIDMALNIPFKGRQYIAYDINTEQSIWYPYNFTPLPVDNFIYDNAGKLKIKTEAEPENGIEFTPQHQVFPFVYESSYSYYGISLLSLCMWDVLYMKDGKNFYTRFVEKYGSPWPVGTYDMNKMRIALGISEADQSKAAKAVADKLTDLLNSMIQDAIFVGPEGVNIDVKSTGTQSNADIYLGHMADSKENISKILLGHSSASDSTSNKLGSESTALHIREDIAAADQRLAENVINTFIRKFSEINYGDAPTVKFKLFEEDDVSLFKARAEKDVQLYNIGWRPTKEYIIKTYNMDEDDFTLIDTSEAKIQNQNINTNALQHHEHKFKAMIQNAEDDEEDEEYPDQNAIDGLIVYLLNLFETKDTIESMLDDMLKLAETSKSLDELLKNYHKLYPKFDIDKFEEIIKKATFISGLHGEHSIKVDNGENEAEHFTLAVLKLAFGKTPEDAVEYLKSKGLKLSANWKESLKNCEAHAFTVAGVLKLDILQTYKDAVEEALKNGSTLKDFTKNLKTILSEKGWYDPKTTSASRIELIYNTNIQSAYMDGRNAYVLFDNIDRRPIVQFISTLDKSTTTSCKHLHNVAMDMRDKDIKYFMPMGHFRCRRRYITFTEDGAKSAGLKITKPKSVWNYKNAPGFDNLPNEPYEPDLSKYPDELVNEFEKEKK